MPEKTREQGIAHGLALVARYDDCDIAAEHDVIYASSHKLTEEDKKELKECGYHWDEEFDCWARFV
jgi:hypothetical protein